MLRKINSRANEVHRARIGNENALYFYQPAAAEIVAAFDVVAVAGAAVVVAVARLSERWQPSALPPCVPEASPRRIRPRQSPAVAQGHQTSPVAASTETLPTAYRVGGRLKKITNEG